MKLFRVSMLFFLVWTICAGVALGPTERCGGVSYRIGAPPKVEQYVDVPYDIRKHNYMPYGQGSCVHASTVTLLRLAGLDDWAKWWESTYHSGEYGWRLVEKLEASGLPYAYTDDGEVEFLEWATRNRFAAGIFYFRRHAVNLVGLDDDNAYILDNNRPGIIIVIEREIFLYNWKEVYGGFAWAIVYRPPPPYPSQLNKPPTPQRNR